jgi:hypothetical protein
LANVLIKEWLAKLSLPRTLITGLSPSNNEALRDHLHDQLKGESYNLIMESANSHKLPNDLIEQLHSLAEETEPSWEDFIPVLSFLHNTSYDSCAQNIPFKLLHGYDPEAQIEVKSSYSDSEANKGLQIYQRVKQLLTEPKTPDISDQENNPSSTFQVGQEVYFWEKSFGDQKWNGPCPIIKCSRTKFASKFPPGHPNGSTTIAFPPRPALPKLGRGRRKTQPQTTHETHRPAQTTF